ncbi:nucleoside recognition domain-containing protein [Polycladidibacter hongkongensis]|uniref:nucleoside recognition domain-containing protein n=1 Tax=Polycladidibacter hongkongensis TaxID=1647556 RepID=UPI000A5D0714|nr:nucleoside recognition domain-containing protein [Pseudovibrio hongkongensis]
MFAPACKKIFFDTVELYKVLLKAMVPTIVLVKFAVEIGALDYLAQLLGPVMGALGLPAAAGIVFASGLLVNNYAACAALVAILPFTPLSVAQATVLLSMVMFAHALPVEQGISRKAGISFVFSSGLRFLTAIAYGALLHFIYSSTQTLQHPLDLSWMTVNTGSEDPLTSWALSNASLLFSLFWVILALVALLRVLDHFKVTEFLAQIFSPFLSIMGISKAATNITMIGVLMGLSYGGGLIIKEAKEGHLGARDVVLSLSFMGICHGLIEDPLFIMAFGGHWSGVVVGRFVFSIVVMIALSRLLALIPDSTFERLFYRPSKDTTAREAT